MFSFEESILAISIHLTPHNLCVLPLKTTLLILTPIVTTPTINLTLTNSFKMETFLRYFIN